MHLVPFCASNFLSRGTSYRGVTSLATLDFKRT